MQKSRWTRRWSHNRCVSPSRRGGETTEWQLSLRPRQVNGRFEWSTFSSFTALREGASGEELPVWQRCSNSNPTSTWSSLRALAARSKFAFMTPSSPGADGLESPATSGFLERSALCLASRRELRQRWRCGTRHSGSSICCNSSYLARAMFGDRVSCLDRGSGRPVASRLRECAGEAEVGVQRLVSRSI